jgi:hypothetical protein
MSRAIAAALSVLFCAVEGLGVPEAREKIALQGVDPTPE